jgi:hypothetical protein
MADAEDSKSSVRKHMRVQVPPSATQYSLVKSKAYLRVRTSKREGETRQIGQIVRVLCG